MSTSRKAMNVKTKAPVKGKVLEVVYTKTTAVVSTEKEIMAIAEPIGLRVGACATQSLVGVITAGQILSEAKTEAASKGGNGLKGVNWKHLYGSILKVAGVSRQTASRWIEIADNPVILDQVNHGILPRNQQALLALCKMSRKDLEKAIKSGKLVPDMSTADARKVAGIKAKKADPAAELNRARNVFLKMDKATFKAEVINLILDGKAGVSELIESLSLEVAE